MIDERLEELASLYAFDLLEGAELARFEAAAAGNGELQALVRDLRNTSASLTHTAPAVPPPPALRQRLLASIADQAAAPDARPLAATTFPAQDAPAVGPGPDNVVRPSFRVFRLLPWAAAACFALASAWLGQQYSSSKAEVAALRDQHGLAEVARQSTQAELERERILNSRQLQVAEQERADLNTRIAQAQTQLSTQQTERDRLLAAARGEVSERERQIAEIRTQLADREQQVVTLSRRADALSASAAAMERQLDDTRQQIAKLTDELKAQGDLADLKITALASMLKNSPLAVAVAVWDPKKQEGVLNVQNLPALAANEDYQLWVVDPQYKDPVDGGVFRVEPATGGLQVKFKAKQPVNAINAFAVTRERKGGVPKAEGPPVLLGKSGK